MEQVFDRGLVKKHRARAAGFIEQHDNLLRIIADNLLDRIRDIQGGLQCVLDLGCHSGQVGRALSTLPNISRILSCDISNAMVRKVHGLRVVADEEFLPFGAEKFDLVVSAMSLHWVNDLPGVLLQARRVLKKDGIFIGTLFGGRTLLQLRRAILDSELCLGLPSLPRISPFIDIKDAGMLLMRAGFDMPVADSEDIFIDYDSILDLCRELRAMGETNALQRMDRSFATAPAIAAILKQNRPVTAQFEVITMFSIKR
jgi:SAM-dependent methyltransferase